MAGGGAALSHGSRIHSRTIESWHTDDCVMAHTRMSHDSHMIESWLKYE